MPCNTKLQQLRRFAFDRLNDGNVASRYCDELELKLQEVQAQPLSMDEKCKKLEETIQRVATNTIGCTENKQIKSGLTRSVQKLTRKRTPPESEPSKTSSEEPRMHTN
jgi:hypothetical protein